MGKLSNEELRKLLSCIRKNPDVTVPPRAGFDSGVHRLGEMYVVISTDPCTGVPEEWFGWLLINYAASDVALFAATPEFCTLNLLGPLGTEPKVFQKAMKQACKAADELEVAIVTGHTGTYEGLSKLVGVCTAYGTVEPDKLITPGNAKAGDLILCAQPVGLETAVNFSLTHKAMAQKIFGTQRTEELAGLVHMQSCVREALRLAELGGVHAMHDATEGGLTAALIEVAEAAHLGFRVEFEKVPISPEALKLQQAFKLTEQQVLSISSTGTIIAAVDPQAKERIQTAMDKNNYPATFIGEFTKNPKRIFTKNQKPKPFPEAADDPYTRILSGKL
jgi:hydrogenase maturation factor